MNPNQTYRSVAVVMPERQVDHAVLQAVVDRRLALRLGVSAPVAAAISALAGLGPQAREARR